MLVNDDDYVEYHYKFANFSSKYEVLVTGNVWVKNDAPMKSTAPRRLNVCAALSEWRIKPSDLCVRKESIRSSHIARFGRP